MSGAPVYCEKVNRIVGLIALRYDEPGEIIPCGIPIEEVAEIYPPLAARLQEERVLAELANILLLGDWFTDKTLKGFYRGLPFPDLPGYEDLGEDKPQAILDELRSRKWVYDFIKCLQLKRSDIPLDGVLQLLPPHSLGFVNRQSELDKATGRFALSYIFFEAPAGFGKTTLLSAIQQRDIAEGRLCIYVEVPPDTDSALALACTVTQQAGCVTRSTPPHVGNVAWLLSGHLQHWLQDRESKRGLTLIIDSAERLPEEEIGAFLNDFLDPLLGLLFDFDVRFRLAGRYTGGRWAQQAQNFPLEVIPLSPFQFQYVRDTLSLRFPRHAQLDTYAAHVMHLTGGHPGCMARILNSLGSLGPAEEHFARNGQTYRQFVLEVARDTRELIPESLREMFDVLSVFRRYNYTLLQSALNEKLIDYEGDVRGLEKDLTRTYLMDRDRGFIQDEIVRRLLALRLRWEEPEIFLEISEKVRELHKAYLAETYFQPEITFIELLYQELACRFYQSDGGPAAREGIREQFFVQDGVLGTYLEQLRGKPESNSIGASLRNILHEGIDWEFQFVVNFFLRESEYTNEPYRRLYQKVRTFFS
jgi:hypothetical protein